MKMEHSNAQLSISPGPFSRYLRTSQCTHSKLSPSKGIFIYLSNVNKGLQSRSSNILSIISLQKKRNKNFVISFADV